MDALDLILGGTCGGLVWTVLQLRKANADLRAHMRTLGNIYVDGTWKAQKRDASGRFA